MFVSGRPRLDAVALIMIVLLPVTGVIDMNEALAGFSDPNIVLVAALFVLGEGLVRTGVAQNAGDWLVARGGSSETRLLVLLMLAVGLMGSFMSSTAVVAILSALLPGTGANAAEIKVLSAVAMKPALDDLARDFGDSTGHTVRMVYATAGVVKDRIRELVANEKDEVLSDDRIVTILGSDGVEIARRTVAKYRESLRIPSSVERKRKLANGF